MTRKWLQSLLAVLVSACCWAAQVQAGVVSLASDPSWTVTLMSPDESPGTEVGPAQCYPIPVAFNPADIPGACVVWIPGWKSSTPADMQGDNTCLNLRSPAERAHEHRE